MSKFHVGDKVRVAGWSSAWHGYTGNVVAVSDDPPVYQVNLGQKSIWFHEDALRPAMILAQAEAKAEAAPGTPDPVNHPSHYKTAGVAEVIDITEHLSFNRGNAVKYLARAGKKDGADELQDLKKALWYVTREIARVEKERGGDAGV